MNKVVEISSSGNHVSKYRGFLTISNKERDSKVPLDEINSIIVSGFNNTFSSSLIQELKDYSISLIFCDSKFTPAAMLWNFNQTLLTKEIVESQLKFEKDRDRISKLIVHTKIKNQYEHLRSLKRDSQKLKKFIMEIEHRSSRDSEAQAARVYWRELYGSNFKRSDSSIFQNKALNYGYAILRSAACRHIMAQGLHPSFGHLHTNKENFFCLADDLMEIFRPYVDQLVHKRFGEELIDSELEPRSKEEIAEILNVSILVDGKRRRLNDVLERVVIRYKELLSNSGDWELFSGIKWF